MPIQLPTLTENEKHALNVGDLVLLATKNLNFDAATKQNKFNMQHCGLFPITETIVPVTFRLGLSKAIISHCVHNAFHANLLVR